MDGVDVIAGDRHLSVSRCDERMSGHDRQNLIEGYGYLMKRGASRINNWRSGEAENR